MICGCWSLLKCSSSKKRFPMYDVRFDEFAISQFAHFRVSNILMMYLLLNKTCHADEKQLRGARLSGNKNEGAGGQAYRLTMREIVKTAVLKGVWKLRSICYSRLDLGAVAEISADLKVFWYEKRTKRNDNIFVRLSFWFSKGFIRTSQGFPKMLWFVR